MSKQTYNTEMTLSYFCTTTFTKAGGGGGGRLDPPAISKNVAPIKVKFCTVLETSLNVLEMLKFFT